MSAKHQIIIWMADRGYATGHGDTIEDLLDEIDWQACERGCGHSLAQRVLLAINQRDKCSVAELQQYFTSAVSQKELYNVLGYLTRRGKVKRLGYGQYKRMNP